MPPRLVLWSCVVISIVYQIKITICGAPCTPALLSRLRRPFMFRVVLDSSVFLSCCGCVLLGVLRCEQRRDSITPTGNARDTRQTRVTGTGFLGVRIANPYPYP